MMRRFKVEPDGTVAMYSYHKNADGKLEVVVSRKKGMWTVYEPNLSLLGIKPRQPTSGSNVGD